MAQWQPMSSVPELAMVLGPAQALGYQTLQYNRSYMELDYAGFWLRVVAYIIDAVILWVVGKLIKGAFQMLTIGSPRMTREGFLIATMVRSSVSIVVDWLYFALMESSTAQASVGKMALGIKVTDLAGNKISFARATGRYFGRVLSGLLLCVGFLMVAFTDRKQGLHDMMAGTLVTKK
jgi:uncharacterized RDD family membrane protein YckC